MPLRVAGWASRNIQPEDPTLSFFAVVKKEFSGHMFHMKTLKRFEKPLVKDHNDWIEKEV